jgi:hypothetical protein
MPQMGAQQPPAAPQQAGQPDIGQLLAQLGG